MTNEKRRIYLLDSKKLNPETIAVTFAKTSRSPLAFDQIAEELSDEKSKQFHEKWVVGYGHASVAEHAMLHIAVENISRLAVECLESNRLASYTEKSSRYQVWDADNFFIPPELQDTDLEQLYTETVRSLFERYLTAREKVKTAIKADCNEELTERTLHTKCMDICRYYLPAAATANVGITINARSLEHALRKMLSHPLEEVRSIGMEIKSVAEQHLPALIKYVDEVPYLQKVFQQTPQLLKGKSTAEMDDWCQLLDHQTDFETRILSALLYENSNLNWEESQTALSEFSSGEIRSLLDILFTNKDKHDIPLRVLEYSNFSFDLLMDQGAYFEFKRHRMMTQTVQPLTPTYGFAIPKLISQAGLEADFTEAMQLAKETYHQIAEKFPSAASYVVPNAYNRRVLASMNLRTAVHFINLRTAPNAHFAIRRIALRMKDLIREHMDLFKPHFFEECSETSAGIEDAFFTSTRTI